MRTAIPEYEPQLPVERERKFVPRIPYFFDSLKERAYPIEQLYVSHPDEDFSVRLRKTGEDTYTATLKTRSPKPDGPLERIEIETVISETAYRFYAEQPHLPRLQKMRTDIAPGVSCDWIEGRDVPLIEAEEGTPEAAQFLRDWAEHLDDVTRNPGADNEQIAHDIWQQRSGQDSLKPLPGPSAIEITKQVAEKLEGRSEPLVIGIRGRSGSGKTTLAQETAFWLAHFAGGPVPIISTDDYHRGKRWLLESHQVESWQNWDDPVVYNTNLLAFELHQYLTSAEPIPRRRFNFTTEEPEELPESYPMAPIIIVEGLFPHSPALKDIIDTVYEVPTPLATSLGRRIMRDIGMRLNDSLGSASDILRYQLEVAEPTYQQHS